jgi:hypothetical protein
MMSTKDIEFSLVLDSHIKLGAQRVLDRQYAWRQKKVKRVLDSTIKLGAQRVLDRRYMLGAHNDVTCKW